MFLLTTMKKEEGIDFDNEEMEDTFKMQIPMMVFKNICVNEGPEFCMWFIYKKIYLDHSTMQTIYFCCTKNNRVESWDKSFYPLFDSNSGSLYCSVKPTNLLLSYSWCWYFALWCYRDLERRASCPSFKQHTPPSVQLYITILSIVCTLQTKHNNDDVVSTKIKCGSKIALPNPVQEEGILFH